MQLLSVSLWGPYELAAVATIFILIPRVVSSYGTWLMAQWGCWSIYERCLLSHADMQQETLYASILGALVVNSIVAQARLC